MSEQTDQKKPKISTTAKGRLVEKIVASFYEGEDLLVEKNIKLPARGNSGRIGEIDVLLTKNLAGIKVQIAIECKNEKDPVQIDEIREFVGKLQDVGIPTQYAIIASASGFSNSSIEYAKEFGIKPLVVNDSSSLKNVKQALANAIQNIIYLLVIVEKLEVKSEVPYLIAPFVFCDENKKILGAIPDGIARAWLNEQIPNEIRQYEFELVIPENWYWTPDGSNIEPVGSNITVNALIKVVGLVVRAEGRVEHQTLTNALDNNLERFNIKARFFNEGEKITLAVKTVNSEEELKELLNPQNFTNSIRLETGRIRLPRIRFNNSYWPLSKRVLNRYIETGKAHLKGEGPDPSTITFEELEGTDLKTIWEE